MNKAKNIKELKQVFRFNEKYLSEEDSLFFENLYAKNMQMLKIDIEDSMIHYDTFYVTGQSGNGKSTAVNQLKKEKDIADVYDVRHIFANDLFDFPDEVTIVDVLLMVGISLSQNNTDLEKKYLGSLQELKDLNVGKLEKSITTVSNEQHKESGSVFAGLNLGFAKIFKFGTEFKDEYINNEQNREVLRQIFLPNKRELLNLINDIIKGINDKEGDKKLLLILDDLEKKNLSKDLFTKDKDILEKMEVLKIIMIPVNYATSGKVYKLSLRLSSNPLGEYQDDDKIAIQNMKNIKKLVYKRIDDDFKYLIPNETNILDKIIMLSGGNIRQLLRIISDSATYCRYSGADSISEKDVNEASQEILNLLAIGVNTRQSFLKYIKDHNRPDENENDKFIESIADNSIFAYFNGEPWYEVNPALKEYVR
ncbi:MAG TPA: hypothetical protein EYG97_05410 [Arcobacter sp.]|nr:hypothetical protein [Arcobacter sp.]HIP56447.1 hypothetical protein [Arcobacter sp.]